MVQPVAINNPAYGQTPSAGPQLYTSNMQILEDNALLSQGLQSQMGPGYTSSGFPSIWGNSGGWSNNSSMGMQPMGYIENSNQALELLAQVSKGETKSNRELLDEAGNQDGALSMDELKKAASNENLSPSARAAAQFFLRNPGEWRGLGDSRGRYNGVVDFASLDTALINPNAPIDRVDAANRLKAKFDAIKGLSGTGGETDLGIFKIPNNNQEFIDTEDLKAVIADRSGKFDETTKEAARFFLTNEHEKNKLDVSDHGRRLRRVDDKIAMGDLEEYTKNSDDGAYLPADFPF